MFPFVHYVLKALFSESVLFITFRQKLEFLKVPISGFNAQSFSTSLSFLMPFNYVHTVNLNTEQSEIVLHPENYLSLKEKEEL